MPMLNSTLLGLDNSYKGQDVLHFLDCRLAAHVLQGCLHEGGKPCLYSYVSVLNALATCMGSSTNFESRERQKSKYMHICDIVHGTVPAVVMSTCRVHQFRHGHGIAHVRIYLPCQEYKLFLRDVLKAFAAEWLCS
jgi:hypothetical protein